MKALYIHIPFCIQKCNYCDFTSIPYDADLAASYVYALKKELKLRLETLPTLQLLESIYIGGGTPTCLTGEMIADIINYCRQMMGVTKDAEITVECNPGTVDLEKIVTLVSAGVNRISIGVQACQTNLLKVLGRIHGFQEVCETVEYCREAGLTNISLDLIYGVPGQTMEDWHQSLEQIVALNPEHISAYNLKLEQGTKMYRDVNAGLLQSCDEDLEVEMYNDTIEFLRRYGYHHYEISNFAKMGKESRHNKTYWLNDDYLGIGVSAHSLVMNTRFSNIENVELYSNNVNANRIPEKDRILVTEQDRISEGIFLGLRLIKGININEFYQKYNIKLEETFGQQITRLQSLGLLELKSDILRLTKKGLLFSNSVFVEFIE